ncbi:ADP-ribosyltransferase [Actinoplanes auranticolor]|uniref:ADP-ribosyltransferase exoenzyme n=1 Tax=Actinoplanes auranticolor TaxID=47988 RepID=A0A919SYI3_9ACTN|nr:ADP-ribosyltransferase [Actinoplanes auranticolor]GIM80812.1 hypothetical protein Aau02nite_92160 [Actinoplanes auranticolor]
MRGTTLSNFSWSRDLTDTDRGALVAWNEGRNALQINQAQREGDELFAKFLVKDLDSVISAGSFNEPTIVYRGLAVPDGCLPGLMVNTMHTNRGYMSVSLRRTHAQEFAARRAGRPYADGIFTSISKTGEVPVVVEFTLPAGTLAAELKGNGLDEYLLARNSSFRITGVHDGLVRAVPV